MTRPIAFPFFGLYVCMPSILVEGNRKPDVLGLFSHSRRELE